MCAFVGVDCFQVDHVANDMVFVVNAVAAMHVARHPSHIQGLAAAVALDQADHLWHRLTFVHQTANSQAALQTQTDFGLHVGQFLLDQLVLCQGAAKLNAVHGVLAGAVPAVFCCTQSTPCNAIASFVQATKRTF